MQLKKQVDLDKLFESCNSKKLCSSEIHKKNKRRILYSEPSLFLRIDKKDNIFLELPIRNWVTITL